MSVVTFEEMEAKRQEMIASLKDVAAAMTRCVSIIEDYTRLSPASLPAGASAADIAKAVIGAGEDKKGYKKREKKLKDPNAPKRPPSAYILFQNEVRDDIRKANPNVPYKDILSRISEQWKTLPESQKKVFEDAYQDASVAFRTADESYKAGTALPAVVAPEESDAENSDSDSSSADESTPPPAPKPAPVIPPQIISAAVTASEKKEKKRKNKEEHVAAAPAVPDSEKKKKKKKESKE